MDPDRCTRAGIGGVLMVLKFLRKAPEPERKASATGRVVAWDVESFKVVKVSFYFRTFCNLKTKSNEYIFQTFHCLCH